MVSEVVKVKEDLEHETLIRLLPAQIDSRKPKILVRPTRHNVKKLHIKIVNLFLFIFKTNLYAIPLLGTTQGSSILDLLLTFTVVGPTRSRKEEVGQPIEIPQNVGIADTIPNQANGPSLRSTAHRPGNVELRRCSPPRGQDEGCEFGQLVRHDIDPFLESLYMLSIKTTTDTIRLEYRLVIGIAIAVIIGIVTFMLRLELGWLGNVTSAIE